MPPKAAESEARALDRPTALIFKQVLHAYETKQYSKGVKLADSVLKKFPGNGETLAMKGLLLSNMDKRDEGWECVRKGLRCDLKSHLCWHVYGMLYRAEKDWEEALKCYARALSLDPFNLVIQRDLAVIQSQLRLYPALCESRNELMKRNPEQRGNWTAYAVALFLNKDYKAAEKVLDDYEEQYLPIKPVRNAEHSMTTLFKNTILAASGDTSSALAHIRAVDSQILDKLEIQERIGRYQLVLEQYGEAATTYEALMDRNPDRHQYYGLLEKALQLRDAEGRIQDTDKLHKHYIELQSRYPKSTAARRLPLDWLEGDAFRSSAEEYLRNLLQKGIPSTFVDVKALYKDKAKADAMEQIVERLVEEWKTKPVEATNGHGHDHDAAPTSVLWSLYFLAQSYDYRRNLDRAMELINEAVIHTPTLVELHLTKARILKHMGKVQEAAEQMNQARELDLQDRFINTKCTKYYLRADQNAEAINAISLFANTTLGGGAIGDLQEMQSLQFLVEDGLSYLRQKYMGLALKRFDSVRKVMQTWFDDLYDFHTYCFRKATLDAYVEALQWSEGVFASRQYKRACRGAVSALLQLHQHPELKLGPLDAADATDADKKKEKKRFQKVRARVSKDATKEPEKKDDVNARKIDQDPVGDKLAGSTTPLEDALAYIKPWVLAAPADPEPQGLLAGVYASMGNWEAVLEALRKEKELGHSENKAAHLAVVKEALEGADMADELKLRIETALA
ncbi:NatA N-acetyltransferase complex subunit [Protomyces lactucae-debilis]|uniref:NatA N-acetyltransferase complex subunit n=1 Tax=Protomyces lactucae-debilis TaxID=2754530 RepID=A0A1Y2F4C9_PROLT|nr:NatA N-acetyltransferase complex subunit [Protomyces lactucae-debilis]ORY78176.1 NatA N-acetyltransferase complex subunit [Protomyces lactucae-debilis]